MDGYSIQEAAEVLGVPKRRIRELVERGVILGSDEGDDGLRVYLQPRPPASFERQAREAGPEASPFRELLNEFRNLTERYGQALLALGESRGEVAALRGRVEALETRMDLRLGTSAGPAVVEWHAPPPAFEAETLADLAPADARTDAAPAVEATPEPVAVPDQTLTDAEEPTPSTVDVEPVAGPDIDTASDAFAAPSEAEAQAEAEAEVEVAEPETETKQRPRRGISAIVAGGIAEALARAIDPSTGELPPAEFAEGVRDETEPGLDAAEAEPVEAVMAEQVEAVAVPEPGQDMTAEPSVTAAELAEAGPESDELILGAPESDESADEELVAPGPEVDQSVYSADIEEPDWLVEGEYTWLDAAQAEQRGEQDEAAADEEQPSNTFTQAELAADDEQAASDAFTDPEASAVDELAPVGEPEPETGQPEPGTAQPDADLAAEPEAASPLAGAGDEESGASAEPEQELMEETAPQAAPSFEFEGDLPPDAIAVEDVTEPVDTEAVEPAQVVPGAEPAGDNQPEAATDASEAVAGEDASEGDAAPAIEANPDAAAPVSSELPEDDHEPAPEPAFVEAFVAEQHIFEALPAVDVVDVAGEIEFEALPQETPPPDVSSQGAPETAPRSPSEPTSRAPEAASGEVPLLWLGGEFDDSEDYAAEIEVGTAGWQTAAPAAAGGERRDELTRIAQDQGWDATEVEAIRSLLEPAPEAEAVEPPADTDDVPVVGASDDSPEPQAVSEPRTESGPLAERESPAEPGLGAESGPPAETAPESSTGAAGSRWPAEDRTVNFTLPGGDELRRALDALGLPASEQEREQAMAAQRAQWARSTPRQGDATRALLRPALGREPAPDAPPAESAEATPDGHVPEGEPEWLRGRRDPAARAYRRLRRIFPN